MNVQEIYLGSNGDATKALYAELEKVGPLGLIAVNLFRAQKCSERAKVYRGRGYRQEAYGRKSWSMGLLCEILEKHAADFGIRWGWKVDPIQLHFPWVLYVDIPTGQVSFHTDIRGKGPDYPGDWDKAIGQCPARIVAFTESVLPF